MSRSNRFRWLLGSALLCFTASARAQIASGTPASQIKRAPMSQEFEIAVLTRDALVYDVPTLSADPSGKLEATTRVLVLSREHGDDFLWATICGKDGVLYLSNSALQPTGQKRRVRVPVWNETSRERFIAAAMAQLGKSYMFGAAGPKAFDNSGLVLFAARKAGFSLARVSRQQALQGVGPRLSIRDLQRGDRVYFDAGSRPGIDHSAIYLGQNRILEANGGHANRVKISLLSGPQTRNDEWFVYGRRGLPVNPNGDQVKGLVALPQPYTAPKTSNIE